MDYKEKNGVFGVLYAGGRMLYKHLETAQNGENAGQEATEAGEGAETAENQTGQEADADENQKAGGLPGWYPEDSSSFQEFHDDAALRVVDQADIFTDEEEASMEERLKDIRKKLNRDIVIFTDTSAHGKDHEVYAADFYDYNGYGCGDDYEGACLMICMDPDDRGWGVACSGPETRELYSYVHAHEMDAALKEHLSAAEYAAGVEEWITHFYNLYVKGDPFAPEWLPENGEEPERTHDAEAPRIDDTALLLTKEQRETLGAEASALGERYGLDIIIHTSNTYGGLGREEYAQKYYEYNGYGLGEGYDGIALVLVRQEAGSARWFCSMYASGKGLEKLTQVNQKRLLGFCDSKFKYSEHYYEGMEQWLRQIEHMQQTGRVPRSAAYWIWIVFFSLVCGLIYGGVSLVREKSKMEAPTKQFDADGYLVSGSLQVKGGDHFLYDKEHSVYSPVKEKEVSSGSSSDGSSYRSSYTGSSGRSHTGSSGRF